MQTHNLKQGSPQWLAYRSTHFNASDAAAMLGMSPHKTRSQLMHELHTGISPEVDAHTQSRFDAGHAAEAAARPMAEIEIGQDLYPVVGSIDLDGLPLSASFDGLTMMEDIVWEHKLMNVDLADTLANGIIPDAYHPQLEQQLLVSGAGKALFMATSADKTAMECVWYTGSPVMRQRLIDGWKQFATDLASYTPTEVTPKPVGRTPETLPALHIEVTGMVTASNLAEFKTHALAVFGSINRELTTDAQFADAEKTVKWCKEIETRLAAAKQHALSQTESIDALFNTIDDISVEARAVRLELDKLVKARKDTIRTEMVMDGRNALADHLDTLKGRIGANYMPQVAQDFAGVIKGKHSVDSMRDAIAVELARCKIAANELADKITLNLRAIHAQVDFGFLFADVAQLVLKAPDDLAAVVQNRISAHQAKEAARIEAERAHIAEQERIKAEAAAKARADAEIAAATAKARAEAHAQAQSDAAAKRASDEATAVINRANGIGTPISQGVTCRRVEQSMFEHEQNQPTTPAAIAQAAIEMRDAQIDRKAIIVNGSDLTPSARIKLGEISERLGFTLTADFLAILGFHPVETIKAAKMFRESDFPRMCAALIRHIQTVARENVDVMRIAA